MDGMAGLIHSADDFGVNDAGIAITETTIGYFSGFDPNGVPEFARVLLRTKRLLSEVASVGEQLGDQLNDAVEDLAEGMPQCMPLND